MDQFASDLWEIKKNIIYFYCDEGGIRKNIIGSIS